MAAQEYKSCRAQGFGFRVSSFGLELETRNSELETGKLGGVEGQRLCHLNCSAKMSPPGVIFQQHSHGALKRNWGGTLGIARSEIVR
jgi:hypothetical protein